MIHKVGRDNEIDVYTLSSDVVFVDVMYYGAKSELCLTPDEAKRLVMDLQCAIAEAELSAKRRRDMMPQS